MKDPNEAFYKLAPELIDVDVDEEGKRDYAGRRFTFVDANVFARIFDNMEEVAGPVIRSRIKKFGETAGKEIGEKMDKEFKKVGKKQTLGLLWKSGFDISSLRAIKPTDTETQLEKIMGYGTHVGWFGDTEIEEYTENEEIRIRINNTFESYSYGVTGRKECRFILGVIEGIIEHFWTVEVEGEELQCDCESIENEACIFEVTAS